MQSKRLFFLKYTRLNTGVLYSSVQGIFNKVPPKYLFEIMKSNIHQRTTFTDNDRKKSNRNYKLQQFIDNYKPLLLENKVSIICMVIYADYIKDVPRFINYFKYKRLKKLGIITYSHYSVCDIGDKDLRPHHHVFIVTDPIKDAFYKKVFPKSKAHKYKAIPMNESFGLIPYVMKKDIYSKTNKPSHSGSRKFLIPLRNLSPILSKNQP